MVDDNCFAALDRPEILEIIFPIAGYSSYSGETSLPPGASLHYIEVEPGVLLGCGLWPAGKHLPTILYFHGNGETVGSHEWIAPEYKTLGVNLFVSEYRGYGLSNGSPTVTNMLTDSRSVFRECKKTMLAEGYADNFFVMGRSLGSLPAIEVADRYQGDLRGMIIESGSATNFRPLWEYYCPAEKDVRSANFLNGQKVKSINIPTLIIHGEMDDILPVSEGIELFENSGSQKKEILIVPGAGHNDLMILGHDQYFARIGRLVRYSSR
jgi:uncharacterized protein